MVYGNRYEEVKPAGKNKNMRHKWTVFIKFEKIGKQRILANSDLISANKINPNLLIDKVRYGLHSTFRNPHVDVLPSPS